MSVRVVARIRPLLPKELDKDIIVRAASSEDGRPPNVVKIPSPKNEAEEFSFTFNSVYDQATTQEALFNAEVAPHVKALFQGLDITIFAYGVTGTGKTHTMRGGMKLADRGVIPRILSHVFRRGKKIAKDSDGRVDVDVALSYYEIYNDKVYDLLEPPEKRTPTGLPLREKDNKTHVVGLSERACADLRDFERLYIAANQNRVTAATKLNAHSSRSHAILRVKVTQTTRADDGSGAVVAVRESTASAIDLAGSEDNRRTDNGRERLVESAAINKSLFVLSQCVDAIARGEKRIPYRESKMTRILSLGQNNGITVMILNLAPVRSYHLDTLSSLNVSSRAKRIEVREIENEVVFKQLPRSLCSTASSSAASSSTSLTSMSTSASSVGSGGGGGSGGLARQPLRALTSNTHNIQTGNAAKAAADKPVKAFAVYTDLAATTKPAASKMPSAAPPVTSIPPPSQPSATPSLSSARMGPLSKLAPARPSLGGAKLGATLAQRPSDAAESRPSRLARPSIHPYSSSIARPAATRPAAPAAPETAALFSAEQIEAIVERKVAEALAARAQKEQEEQQEQKEQQQELQARGMATPPYNGSRGGANGVPSERLSEAVHRRLEALERRIEDSTRADDPRAEGLQCLLLARQHKEVGDDAAALRYYEQALPFFPGQAKLLGKIDKLRAKLARDGGRKMSGSTTAATGMTSGGSPRKPGPPSPSGPWQAQQLSVHKRKRALGGGLTPATPTFRRAVSSCEAGGEAGGDVDGDVDDEAGTTARLPGLSIKVSGARSWSCSGAGVSRKAAKTSPSSGPSSSNGDDADDESSVGSTAVMTPRKKTLLDIVNSRDVTRIGSLAGVSPRKARSLVDYLERGGGVAGLGQRRRSEDDAAADDEMDSDASDAEKAAVTMTPVHEIASLAQLRNVPGMGGATVERAYEGLSVP